MPITFSFVGIHYSKHAVIPQNIIALTFDDGPDTLYTPKILDILKEKNVRATFFLIGRKINKYPEITKRIYEEGHCIGNHTYNHMGLVNVDSNIVKYEVLKTESLLDSLLGKTTKIVRIPWGKSTKEHDMLITNLGYKIVNWDLDSRDWVQEKNTVDDIIKRVVSQAASGKIVLFHSADYSDKGSRIKTIKALPKIIDELRAKNYKFVTIKKLFKTCNKQATTL